jgi:hypothetical protein
MTGILIRGGIRTGFRSFVKERHMMRRFRALRSRYAALALAGVTVLAAHAAARGAGRQQ